MFFIGQAAARLAGDRGQERAQFHRPLWQRCPLHVAGYGLDLAHLYVRPCVIRHSAQTIRLITAFHGIVMVFVIHGQQRAPVVLAQWQGQEVAVSVANNSMQYGHGEPAPRTMMLRCET